LEWLCDRSLRIARIDPLAAKSVPSANLPAVNFGEMEIRSTTTG